MKMYAASFQLMNAIRNMARCLWLPLFLGSALAAPASADSWPSPQIQAKASKNGEFVVRVIPGTSMGDVDGFAGLPKGPYAKAELHRLDSGAYKKVRDITLLNPVAPVDIELTDKGNLITLDNWHNMGGGQVLVLYSPEGEVIKKYTLQELYPGARMKKFERSVSSTHWRCQDLFSSVAREKMLVVLDRIGGLLSVNTETGAVTYSTKGRPC